MLHMNTMGNIDNKVHCIVYLTFNHEAFVKFLFFQNSLLICK